MNETLHRLVYLSRNTIDGDGDTMQREISQILRSARNNNAKVDITGALMFTSDYFAQALEGPYENVQRLFDIIQKDERHADMIMIDFRAVENRLFEEWAMAYIGEEDSLEDRFFMIAEETNFDPSWLSENDAFDTLREKLEELNNGAQYPRCA